MLANIRNTHEEQTLESLTRQGCSIEKPGRQTEWTVGRTVVSDGLDPALWLVIVSRVEG